MTNARLAVGDKVEASFVIVCVYACVCAEVQVEGAWENVLPTACAGIAEKESFSQARLLKSMQMVCYSDDASPVSSGFLWFNRSLHPLHMLCLWECPIQKILRACLTVQEPTTSFMMTATARKESRKPWCAKFKILCNTFFC